MLKEFPAEWLHVELQKIVAKLRNEQRLTRSDMTLGAMALRFARRNSEQLSTESRATLRTNLAEMNALLASNPALMPIES